MLQSMTGFASKTITVTIGTDDQTDITLNVKSLNSRYFEANCKMPSTFLSLETAIISLLKKKLLRGKIYFTIHISNPGAFEAPAQPALNVVKGYIEAIDRIKKLHPFAGDVTIADIIHLPHVFEVPEAPIDDATKDKILDSVMHVTDMLVSERIKEGSNLADDLLGRAHEMQRIIYEIEKEAAIHLEERKKILQEKLEQAGLTEEELEEAKRAMIYAELDKLDINEEIVRFKSHIQNLLDIIQNKTAEKGKQIDFTLQELFRETNTIAAKCNNAQISNMAIAIKVELEKSREMAQNIV
jgi:uncharacterized protein (TIGR00255 family)